MKNVALVAAGFVSGVVSVGYLLTNKTSVKFMVHKAFEVADVDLTEEQSQVLGEIVEALKTSRAKKS